MKKHSQYLDHYNRTPKAYGGIMGDDGRRQYGIGSWFQEKIMDPIKNNPVIATTAAALGAQYLPFSPVKGYLDPVIDPVKKFLLGETVDGKTTKGILNKKRGSGNDEYTFGEKITEGLGRSIVPVAGGMLAGLFSDRLNSSEDIEADRGVGLGIQNVGKVANLLDVQQGQNAGLRFLPEVSTRKYSPAEMALSYADTTTEPIAAANLADGGRPFEMNIPNYEQQIMDPNMMEQINILVQGLQNQGLGMEEIKEKIMMEVPNMTMGFAEGGGIGGMMGGMMEEKSEMLDLGGMEKDYREEGGFVPIGEYEKKMTYRQD